MQHFEDQREIVDGNIKFWLTRELEEREEIIYVLEMTFLNITRATFIYNLDGYHAIVCVVIFLRLFLNDSR